MDGKDEKHLEKRVENRLNGMGFFLNEKEIIMA